MANLRGLLSCACLFHCTAEERILSATYGIARCLGVKDASDWEALAELGFNVVTVDTAHGLKNATSARSTTGLKSLCGFLSNIEYADGLPITFSSPVDKSTLDATDFNFTLSNGSWVQPICVTTAPAGEGNEGNTVATIGYFGDGLVGDVYPVKVTIVGELYLIAQNGKAVSAQGLEFTDTRDLKYTNPESSPRMVQARLQPFSTAGEQLIGIGPWKGRFPNHCGHLYGSMVTHRIRVILSGGGTTDGVTSFLPDTPNVFQVLLQNATQVAAPYVLGIADLGSERTGDMTYAHDGDNYLDVCISDPRQEIVASIAQLRMPCAETKLYYPRGAKHWSGCKDHAINVDSEISYEFHV